MGMKRNRFEFGKSYQPHGHMWYCPVLTREHQGHNQVAIIRGFNHGHGHWSWDLIKVAEGYEYLNGWKVYPGKMADAKKAVMARQWLGPNDAKPNQGAAA